MNENSLRGKIVGMYGTLLKFAEVIGWSSRKVYDIVNGNQEPTASDIETMCDALNVVIPEEMRSLFFSKMST